VPGEELAGPLPRTGKLVYPWIGFDVLEDAFDERKNQDQIERTEDVLLGFRAGVRLGYASEALGSDRNAWMFSGYVQDGMDLRPGSRCS